MTSISGSMDGVVFTNRDAVVELLNPAAENLMGLVSFGSLGRPLRELDGYPELMEPLLDDLERVRQENRIARTVELHHSQQDLLYIKAETSAVADHRGEFGGTLMVLQDVTDDYKSDQLKNQYLSIVAHELRTPLTGIKTFASLLAKAALGDLNDRQQQAIDAIREQSLQLERQIDKLINLGYLESNDYGQDLEVIDVDELVAAAAAVFVRPALDQGITLEIGCSSEASVAADRAGLKRAIQALIENAIKFTPEGGPVAVRVSRDGDAIEFEVRDPGIGIDPRYHRRIFDKFFQVEDPLTRHHGGAGLGLFVASQILEAHDSDIAVESELGQGAGFSFRLPTYEGSHTLAEAHAAGSEGRARPGE